MLPRRDGLGLGVGRQRAVWGDVAEDLVVHGQHVRIFDGVVGVPPFAPGRHYAGQPQCSTTWARSFPAAR